MPQLHLCYFYFWMTGVAGPLYFVTRHAVEVHTLGQMREKSHLMLFTLKRQMLVLKYGKPSIKKKQTKKKTNSFKQQK